VQSQFVIKIIDYAMDFQEDFTAFMRESANLRHKNILTYVKMIMKDKSSALILVRDCTGQPLLDYLKSPGKVWNTVI
jgi:hypothetical protein